MARLARSYQDPNHFTQVVRAVGGITLFATAVGAGCVLASACGAATVAVAGGLAFSWTTVLEKLAAFAPPMLGELAAS